MAARSRLGVEMGVALLAMTTLCPISHADEAQATGQKVTIGVRVATLSEVQRDRSGYTADGVLVTGVDPEGAAARAGIVRGDILVVVGSVTLRSTADLDKAESKLTPGEEASVVVARNGGRMIKVMSLVPVPQVESGDATPTTDLDEHAKPPVPWEHPDAVPPAASQVAPKSVTAPAAEAAPAEPTEQKPTTPMPAPERESAATAAPEATSLATLGLECQDLDADLAAALGVSASTGAVVLRVKPESPAAAGGIKAGDVITRLGDEPVRGVENLGATLSRLGRSAAWRVQRQGEEREVSLAPPPPPVAAAPQVDASGSSPEDRTAIIAELRTEVESLRSEVNRLRRQLARMRDRESSDGR
jgi:membrane-associated protease RseP (regulator of RpoE activity)